MDPLEDQNLLPSQTFTTAAALLGSVDIAVTLRDGRRLTGMLRTFDQFASLVLQDAIERVYIGNLYAEARRGVYLIRGENVSLVGEIDPSKEEEAEKKLQATFTQIPFEEAEKALKEKSKSYKKEEHRKDQILQSVGQFWDYGQLNDL